MIAVDVGFVVSCQLTILHDRSRTPKPDCTIAADSGQQRRDGESEAKHHKQQTLAAVPTLQ